MHWDMGKGRAGKSDTKNTKKYVFMPKMLTLSNYVVLLHKCNIKCFTPKIFSLMINLKINDYSEL